MSANIRYPNITGTSEKEQLAQIKSYLHQLVNQLNYETPSTGGGAEQTIEVQGGELSYYELRSLIIQDLQDVERRFEQLTAKVETDIEDALTEAKESGEFDGPPGPNGISPTVTVTSISGGHLVTITDASKTQSFVVMDGTIGMRFKLDDGTFLY